jgi:hypothetical protein
MNNNINRITNIFNNNRLINRKRLNQKLDKKNKITKEEYEMIINMLCKNNKNK